MDDKYFVQNIRKIRICNQQEKQSLEIGRSIIDAGVLKLFNGVELAVLLYFLTHLGADNKLQTNPTIISSFLPQNQSLDSINQALNNLADRGIIKISPKRKGDYTYNIKVNLKNLLQISNDIYISRQETSVSIESTSNIIDLEGSSLFNNIELRQSVLANPNAGRDDLMTALKSFIPPGISRRDINDMLDNWFKDFQLPMIKELIRRVDKWLDKHNNSPEKAFYYLAGIIDDWYSKEIFSYERLKHFDQLYRETKEIAQAYGLKEWQNINPTHQETFKSWLSDGYPLSLSVIKYAIGEAVRRKKDGRPSIKYIEDNFINPLKKNRVKSVDEARSCINKKSRNTNKKNKNKVLSSSWDELYWDFEDFK